MKKLEGDDLPATKGELRQLAQSLYDLAQAVLRIDISLNPCPLSKPKAEKEKTK